ncbi:MAG: hypothetical protein IJN49_02495 [Clostridia bacterium]|nr:hypothetical protein [Clostridia bacterium]
MKSKFIISLSIVVLLISVLFTGCDFSISLPGGAEDISQVDINNAVTRVEEVTDDNGNVIGTENVTLSDKEIQEGKDFYSKLDANALEGISDNRYNTATNNNAQNEKSVFQSRNYYVIGRIVKDGKSSTYKLAQSGNKYAIMTVYNGHQIGIIIDYVNIYLVQLENKSYITIPKALLSQAEDSEVKSFLEDDLLDSDKKIVKNGTTKIDGKEVSYSKYDDGSISYYKENTILMTKNNDGTIIYYDTVTNNAPSGFFAPPAGFTAKPLNAESVQEFSDLIGGVKSE